MNTIISFELSRFLKEKGFNQPVRYNYDLTGELHNVGLQNHNEHTLKVSAPTISEVVMWLYDNHGIWIYSYKIEPFVFDDEPYPKYVWISKCDEKFIDTDNGLAVNHHKSPTEAYKAAIDYAFENLIYICKN